MPFTFAHPAIILPFAKLNHKSISLSALVIGSMTPDFEYFLKMKLSGRYSHSIEGIFLMDLPIAILIAFIFHLLVKAPLINNSPAYFKRRLVDLRDFRLLHYLGQHYFGFLICLLIGIASHIFWDGFTHAHGHAVKQFDFLSVRVINEVKLPLFRYLQHASTLVGFIVIALFFHRMKSSEHSSESISIRYWMIVSMVSLSCFVIRTWIGYEYLGDIIVSIISSAFLGLIAAAIVEMIFPKSPSAKSAP
jgi:hypothetical protein